MASETTELLNERGKTHGDYAVQAKTADCFVSIAANAPNSDEMTSVQRDALRMIFVKISRILVGNPHCKDHWDDIAGYATLVSKELEAAL